MKRETYNIEYKREVSNSFLKTVSAFANFKEGTIIFGIDDHRNVVGLSNPEQEALNIENKINDNINPIPPYRIEIDETNKTVSLTVSEGEHKPYFYKGKAYQRNDSATVETDHWTLSRLAREGEGIQFDQERSKEQDLSFSYLDQKIREKLPIEKLGKDTMVSFNLWNPKTGFNNAAALMADHNQFKGTDIVRFGISISEILNRKTLDNISILKQYEDGLEFFRENYIVEEIIGKERIKKEKVPEVAFREAYANALIHRDWSLKSPILIRMYWDKIEIISPGPLPPGITEESYLNSLMTIPGNPTIAYLFFRLGWMEQFGTGIQRIRKAYQNQISQPSFLVTNSAIKVTLPVIASVEMSEEEKYLYEFMPSNILVSRKNLEEKTGFSRNTLTRILKQLTEKGLIERIGSTRAAKYLRR